MRCSTHGLRYGPDGDERGDDFEWAQSRAPDGWHIEGQALPRVGGWLVMASKGCPTFLVRKRNKRGTLRQAFTELLGDL